MVTCRLRDYRSKRKLCCIESDDWGAIRMPSLETLISLKKKGLKLYDDMGYDKYDTLASETDIELLLGVLSSVKDSIGRPAIMTINCIMTNPDFVRIKDSGFQDYYSESFTTTLKNTKGCENSFSLWKEGIDSHLFKAQFHGREHLNVPLWMNLLRTENYETVEAFKEGVYSMRLSSNPGGQQNVLTAYDVDCNDIYFSIQSITEGLDIFEKVFGYKSESMIAPCYTWNKEIEKAGFNKGVKYIQGSYIQRYPHNAETQSVAYHYISEKNEFGQMYLTRNCMFEPSENPQQGVSFCLSQVRKRFKCGVPAIISSHRQNYIGGLNEVNRKNNLEGLKILLSTIAEEFPDVEFVSSDELGSIINKNKANE